MDQKKKDKKKVKQFKEFDPADFIELQPKLTEALKKDAVVTSFGRMNPITIGHEKLVDKIASEARSKKADATLFLSHSQDNKKNPLSYEQKYDFAKKAFGGIVKKSKARSIIEVAKILQDQYKNLIVVVGSDRVKEFSTLLNKYNGKEYMFKSIEVVSAGSRDPDAEGVEGMSASKMRQLATDGDFDEFKKGLPKRLQSSAQKVYDAIREGMQLDEALTRAQRRKRSMLMRRMKGRMARGRKKAARKRAGLDKLKARAKKQAIGKVKAKLAKGKKFADLDFSSRERIEKRLKKMPAGRINRIARKLLPAVKQREKQKFQKKNESITMPTILQDLAIKAVEKGIYRNRQEKVTVENKGPCWDGYKQVGMKKKNEELEEAVNKNKVRKIYDTIKKERLKTLNKSGYRTPPEEEVSDHIPSVMSKEDMAALIKMLAKDNYDADYLKRDLAPYITESFEMELDEAKRDPSKSGGSGYDLYHKDFSSAMKHAYDYAKKKFGIEIDPKEIDDKVASGPRKPSAGKTNSYRLKGKDGKKGVQIQVANLDNKKYELNMYKESVELDEASPKKYSWNDVNKALTKTNYMRGNSSDIMKVANSFRFKSGMDKNFSTKDVQKNLSKAGIQPAKIHDIMIKLEESKNPQDSDIKDLPGSQPKGYFKGVDKKDKEARAKQFARQAKMDDDDPRAYKPAPGDKGVETKPSKYTKKFAKMFGEKNPVEPKPPKKRPHMLLAKNGSVKIDKRFKMFRKGMTMTESFFDEVRDLAESVEELMESNPLKSVRKKAEKAGIPYEIAKDVFDRGVAAWRTGHRPGTTPAQWGLARLNSFATGGKTTKTADKDLHDKWKGKKEGAESPAQRAAIAIAKKKSGKYEVNELDEGINDPAIFKAIFLAGGPGSGKSFTVGQTSLPALGYKIINSDDAFEAALRKAKMDFTPDNIMSPQGQEIRNKAKALTDKKMQLAIDNRLGLVIDGTGKDYDKIAKQVNKMKTLGYDVSMIFVNTDLETAKQRNSNRERSLPDAVVEKIWNDIQKNVGKFQTLFKNKMLTVDNSNSADIKSNTIKAYKKISAWTNKAPTNPIAKDWIEKEKQARGIQEADVYGVKKILAKTVNKKMYQKALEVLKDVLSRKEKEAGGKKKMNHSIEYYAAQISKQYPNVDARTLANMVDENLEWGTDKMTKTYKKDTPGQ